MHLIKQIATQKRVERNADGGYYFDLYHDFNDFPCSELREIDELWVKYSGGRFGFSVQRSIWNSSTGQNIDKMDMKRSVSDAERKQFNISWARFAYTVGWKATSNFDTYDYNNLIFSLKAPRGHLPSEGTGDHVGDTAPISLMFMSRCFL